MIHDEICTYEVSKLAREKGFNLHCTPFYALENFTAEYVDDAGDFYEVDFEKGDLYLNFPIKGVLHKEKMLPAPTQSLLQRWMREEKGVIIVLEYSDNTEAWRPFWSWIVYDKLGFTIEIGDNHSTYELALEDALKYALENLV